MADETAVVSIGEMIDLAIGTPECGVVDFNMLQYVLHCLAHQLKIVTKNVELRGSITRLPTYNQEAANTVNVTEFQIHLSESTPGVINKTEKVIQYAPKPTEETMLVVERVKKSDADRTKGEPKPPTRAASLTSTGKLAIPIPSTEKLSLVTLSKFNILENVVEDIKNRVYGSTKNEDIIEGVRSQTNVNAITDMWTSLNVSSRLEAAEAAIDKLSSLLQDVIAGHNAKPLQSQAPSTMEGVKVSESRAAPAPAVSTTATPAQSVVSHAQLEHRELPDNTEESIAILQEEIDSIKHALNKLLGEFEHARAMTPTPAPTDDFASITAIMIRLNDLEKKITRCCETMGKNEGVLSDQTMSIQDQLEGLHKQIGDLTREFNASKLSPDLLKDFQGIMDLFNTVRDMNDQLKQLHDMAVDLAGEKENRQDHINALLEQIELLKTIKLDREDMAEAIADKADVRMLARKVSHDQFEMACDDLSRGLEHALGKLNIQESLWQQALDDIQREIGCKLDKVELHPVKEFFNNKLRQLQENLKQMASLRREVEAAGAKKKLMKDLNCISCDANAVMQMEPGSGVPQLNPLPAHFSIKPYLTYELDTIRKTQAANVPQRNMHDWENLDKTAPKQPERVRSATNKHICNRYCGGSHTMTTASQRVARVGHFVKQWGPDVVPLSSTLAAGDDGRLYKVTAENVENAKGESVPCTPKSPRKSDPKPPFKGVTVPECRCLDGDHPPAKG